MSRTTAVLLRYVDLDLCGDGPAQRALLGPAERDRHGRIAVPRAAARFVAAQAALRLTTARYCGVPVGELRWTRSSHGKLRLTAPDPSVQVSLSHAGDRAAIAITRGREVGVDLEEIRPSPPPLPLGTRCLTIGPGGFFAAWTRMEACVKASGGRLTDGLSLLSAGPGPVRANDGVLAGVRWFVRQPPGPPGHAAAVAAVGDGPFDLDVGWFRPPDQWSAPGPQPVSAARNPATTSTNRAGSSTHGRCPDRSSTCSRAPS